MRRYSVNSHEAVCRLLALSLVSDGGIDQSEFQAIRDSKVLTQLGISEHTLHEVMQGLCDDLIHHANGLNQLELDEVLIDQLLAEIDEPRLQMTVLRAMLGIVDADGWFADGEAVLIARAMACWQFDWFSVQPIVKNASARRSAVRS
ncbi:TerB family tellurite resistance protein [Deefgea sp. CFH1-16]|uniref:TerB family tellurite resistance protein n=1 Tax=Deefgea sp. CFH1-16 TaxID=2675457 RepID=UPI0015F4B953|nr:TerB family tellurite resistance protein [Deefgea sp. CFH1-16]MBM5573375.1 TerB family tellurite resistance protein [Deefgea sp. CFH1-16]